MRVNEMQRVMERKDGGNEEKARVARWSEERMTDKANRGTKNQQQIEKRTNAKHKRVTMKLPLHINKMKIPET